ncbi:MAG: DNA mismatch repair endonuclease MutL [Ktedonobacterales bacterium]
MPQEVIERIAAGEVVERPASVVRELVDNALDADARTIRVEIRSGGLRLIRVADDGCGITPDDLPLACAPHATSKVAALADLDHITTLGFRGEALSSIAAVAQVEIASACDDSGMGYIFNYASESPAELGATAHPRGTTVAVRDLFAAVPARQTMLRGTRAETARVLSLVRAYALLAFDTAFVFVSDGHLLLQTHGSGERAAVAALYGADVERALLPIGPLEMRGSRIAGYITSRAFSAPTREHIVLAVNRRPVSNRALLAALESGYRPLLRKGRHPVAIVHIAAAPECVDANISPAKTEVLLKDETLIAPALRDAVHHALGSVPHGAALAASVPGLAHTTSVQLRLPLPRKRRGLLLGERRPSYAVPFYPENLEDTPAGVPALEALAQFDDTLILARAGDGHLYLVDQHRAHERALYERLVRTHGLRSDPSSAMANEALPPATPYKVQADSVTDVGAQPAVPDPGPLPTAGQLLLEPVLVELTPRQAALLTPRLSELAALGLDCQPFGGSVFLVRSVPGIADATRPVGTLPAAPVAAFARALAEDAAVDADNWLDTLRISLACRAAVRRGQPLDPRQCQSLLDGLRDVAAPAACPHGSPLLTRFSRSYLTRAFEW